MALQTPTTKEISDNLIAQLEASLNQTIPLLPKSFLRVLSKAFAAVFIILFKYGGFIFEQIFVPTASFKDTEILGVILNPLIEWGRLIGVGDPTPATNAEMDIDVTVENQTGSLPAQSQLLNSGNGFTYFTLTAVLLDAPVVSVTIRAVSDQAGGGGEGAAGNLDAGAIVSFANPLANVARDAVVTAQTVTAADAESEEVYRQRVLDRFQKPPQGGALADYELWGEEVPGIIRVYPYTGEPGEVNVYSEATEESSGNPDGIPTQAQLDAVAASIELDENGLATRRPANAFVNSRPITRVSFDVEIFGLDVDDPVTVQADIEAALKDYFFGREPFIPGLAVPPRKDNITNNAVGSTIEDVVAASGGIFAGFSASETTSGLPLTLFILGEGEKAKDGTITFS